MDEMYRFENDNGYLFVLMNALMKRISLCLMLLLRQN